MSPLRTQPPTQRLPVAAAAAKMPSFSSNVRTENVISITCYILLVFIMIICVNAINHDKLRENIHEIA
jgi:hypothetical protein